MSAPIIKNYKFQILFWFGVIIIFHSLGIWMKYNESLYAIYFQNIFLPIAHLKSYPVDLLPFALGDIVYVCLIIIFIVRIVKLIISFTKKQFRGSSVISVVRFIAIVYGIFLVFWGYNYQKPQIVFSPKVLSAKNETTDEAVLIDSANDLIDKLNVLREQIGDTKEDYFALANSAYSHLGKTVKIDPLKVSLLGRHIYKLGVSGYYNPFTGEGQMVPDLPFASYGFVYLHELAHQIGVASESEANLVAYFVAMNSGNPVLEYTATLKVYRQLLGKIANADTVLATTLTKSLSTKVQYDIEVAKKYADTHDFTVREFSMGIYEHYLKSLGQNEGLNAYGRLYDDVVYCNEHQIDIKKILWQYAFQ